MVNIENVHVDQETEEHIENIIETALELEVIYQHDELPDLDDLIAGGNVVRFLDDMYRLAMKCSYRSKGIISKYSINSAREIWKLKQEQEVYFKKNKKYKVFPTNPEARKTIFD